MKGLFDWWSEKVGAEAAICCSPRLLPSDNLAFFFSVPSLQISSSTLFIHCQIYLYDKLSNNIRNKQTKCIIRWKYYIYKNYENSYISIFTVFVS